VPSSIDSLLTARSSRPAPPAADSPGPGLRDRRAWQSLCRAKCLPDNGAEVPPGEETATGQCSAAAARSMAAARGRPAPMGLGDDRIDDLAYQARVQAPSCGPASVGSGLAMQPNLTAGEARRPKSAATAARAARRVRGSGSASRSSPFSAIARRSKSLVARLTIVCAALPGPCSDSRATPRRRTTPNGARRASSSN
jgi:hypothetical protein